MWFKSIWNWLFFSVPENLEKDFSLELNRVNVKRAKVTSLGFIVLESLVVLVYLLTFKNSLHSLAYPRTVYLGLYILMLPVMIIYFVLFSYFEKDVCHTRRKFPRHPPYSLG